MVRFLLVLATASFLFAPHPADALPSFLGERVRFGDFERLRAEVFGEPIPNGILEAAVSFNGSIDVDAVLARLAGIIDGEDLDFEEFLDNGSSESFPCGFRNPRYCSEVESFVSNVLRGRRIMIGGEGVATIPEPGTALLLAVGLLGLGAVRGGGRRG